jgi:3-hydroxyisobutyrate dehydrogenase-like beta-hydroxyacid dehydrogenase
MGQIARSIMEEGGRLAVSSRGVGSLKRSPNGVMEVQSDFRLAAAADIVINPSAPDAYVDAITEAPDWVYNAATNEWMMAEAIEEAKNITKRNLDEAQVLATWAKFVKSFK